MSSIEEHNKAEKARGTAVGRTAGIALMGVGALKGLHGFGRALVGAKGFNKTKMLTGGAIATAGAVVHKQSKPDQKENF